jgi:hypothetical protein
MAGEAQSVVRIKASERLKQVRLEAAQALRLQEVWPEQQGGYLRGQEQKPRLAQEQQGLGRRSQG